MANLIGKVRVDRRGNSVSDKVHFTAQFDTVPLIEHVANAQIQAGYHPAGYDGPWDMKSVANGDGTFTTTWTCAASCD